MCCICTPFNDSPAVFLPLIVEKRSDSIAETLFQIGQLRFVELVVFSYYGQVAIHRVEEDFDCAVPDYLAEVVIFRRKALGCEDHRKAKFTGLPKDYINRAIAAEIQIS